MRLLAIGDVCGEPGMEGLRRHLRALAALHRADIVICNGENADVLGIRPAQAEQIWDMGVDVITLGNHTWKRREIAGLLDDSARIIRPANFAPQLPGTGAAMLTTPTGYTLCVLNLIGRYNCEWSADNPFTTADRLLERNKADMYVVDFHAEASSEKKAMGYYLDGRVSAVFGTHTHTQTADERVLPKGTGYISDLGMCGAVDSILGIKPEQSLNLFLGGLPERFECPDGPARIEGALFEIEEPSGRCLSVTRFFAE